MRNLLRVLVIGFAAVIALLAAAAIVEVNNARSIASSAAELVNNQLVTARLLDEVEREQRVLNEALYRLSSAPDSVDRERVLADLDQTDNEVRKMVADARGGPNEEAWNNLERAVLDFSTQARVILSENGARAIFARPVLPPRIRNLGCGAAGRSDLCASGGDASQYGSPVGAARHRIGNSIGRVPADRAGGRGGHGADRRPRVPANGIANRRAEPRLVSIARNAGVHRAAFFARAT